MLRGGRFTNNARNVRLANRDTSLQTNQYFQRATENRETVREAKESAGKTKVATAAASNSANGNEQRSKYPTPLKNALRKITIFLGRSSEFVSIQDDKVVPTGLEPHSISRIQEADLSQSGDSVGTESGTVPDNLGLIPTGASIVVSAWPSLSQAARSEILQVVRRNVNADAVD